MLIAIWLMLGFPHICRAATPSPAPSTPSSPPAPTTSTTPSHGFQFTLDAFTSFIDQAVSGSGVVPPEGAGFAAGSPLSPMTPYDTFSSAPDISGVASLTQMNASAFYAGARFSVSATMGIGYSAGSIQNAAYWTENLLPPLNPHLGSTLLPYAITFPTHAGQDDGHAAALRLLSEAIGTNDGALRLRGGWFDLSQTDRFVFVQPPLTNVTPSIGIQTAESLGDGSPALESWPSPPPGLPLDGVDIVAHRGIATAEIANASLPALPGTSARVTIGSVVLDHGEGTRWSGEMLHLVTGGNFLSTTTMFGANAMTNPGPQGPLPSSILGGQRQTVVGLRGTFHVTRAVDATLEIGRAWYDADHVLEPGTTVPGGYYHAALSHAFGRAGLTAEYFRFEPHYATALLPYGAPENVWSVAWSWPGPWLKSNYQLVDNTALGVNRQGIALRYSLEKGPIEVRASYAQFRQIDQALLSNVTKVGFVEGFFLPQLDSAGTSGVAHRYGLWAAWHPGFADITVDYVNDTQHRDFTPAHPEDAVSYQAPQVVVTLSHVFGKHAVADVGYARYAMQGSWAFGSATNVDYRQGVAFAGAQVDQSARAALLLQVRQTDFNGLPSQQGGPSPDFRGTSLVIEQRFHV